MDKIAQIRGSELKLHTSNLLCEHYSASAADSSETLLGKGIASILDLKQQSRSAQEAKERGKSADVLAEVFADTICMTRMVMPKASLLRAFLLLDLKAKPESITKFACNLAEGAALNRITLAVSPLYNQRKLNTSRELLGHLLAGGGFGTSKSIFQPETWQNREKNFDLRSGIEQVGHAAIIGGVSNVPAGYLAGRLFKVSPFGNRYGDLVRATGVGAAAGSVSAGIQALLTGQTENAFKLMTEGCLFGAAGGASGAALMRTQFFANKPRICAPQDLSKPRRMIADSHDLKDQLDVIPRQTESLLERAQNVAKSGYRTDTLSTKSLRDDVEIKNLKTEDEFKDRAILWKEEAARVYKQNGVEIWIPESYASKLDEVLELRITERNPGELTLNEFAAVLDKLDTHPLRNRAHIADLLDTFTVPNPELIKRIVISPNDYVYDHWQKLHDPWSRNNPNAKTIATADTAGEMVWYAPTIREDNYITGMHEWSHLLHFSSGQLRETWPKAALLERDYFVSDYAKRNQYENFAEHSAQFLNPDFKFFFRVVRKTPLRSMLINDSMGESWEYAKARNILPSGLQQLDRRFDYVKDEVYPRALDRLTKTLKFDNNHRAAARAAELLAEYGGPDELELLSNSNDPDPFIRRVMERASRKLQNYLEEEGVLTPVDSTVTNSNSHVGKKPA